MKIELDIDMLDKNTCENTCGSMNASSQPRKSIVQVYFEERNVTLAYYNDRFDLKRGDLVYVEGKLSGVRGRIVDVSYNFKIKLSDYMRVIAVADTHVKGVFNIAGSHFVTFNRETLPWAKVNSWFNAPEDIEEVFITSSDGQSFSLSNLHEMNVTDAIAERGHNYYMQNKVRYLCIDGTHGRAIVEGNKGYHVEFQYKNGEISELTCDCFCSYNCKHQFAAMLQLRDTLTQIKKYYSIEFLETGYFAAIDKGSLFAFAVDGREKGSFTL